MEENYKYKLEKSMFTSELYTSFLLMDTRLEERWARTTLSGSYMVSTFGRKLSLNYHGKKPNGFNPHIMKKRRDTTDRDQIHIRINGKSVQPLVYREIMMVFNPTFNMENLEVNHISGDVEDNNISNLSWVTPKENHLHARENGLNQRKHLNIEQKDEIYKLHLLGLSYVKISKKLDIHAQVVGNTVRAYKKKQKLVNS